MSLVGRNKSLWTQLRHGVIGRMDSFGWGNGVPMGPAVTALTLVTAYACYGLCVIRKQERGFAPAR